MEMFSKVLTKIILIHTRIRITVFKVRVNILYHIVDYYMNTIDDMQNEKDFFYHCNEIENDHDFEIVF